MRRPFSLSPRLQLVADLVPGDGTVRLADVGTDHGRLPVWLIQHGRVRSAVASDLRPGPLSTARALAERWNVSDRISFRLCDGLADVRPEEADVITIAGMGGETIADILAAAPWTLKPGKQYIFQAMSGMDGLRRYLSQAGYTICREYLVQEGATLYVVVTVRPGRMEPLSEGEIWVGRQEKGMDAPLRTEYLAQELKKLERAVSGLTRSDRPEDQDRRKQYEEAVREVAQLKEEWEQWQQ